MTAPALPVARTVAALREVVTGWRAAGERVALVPTMGALHEGHRSLARLAREKADRVVASVFVNPRQFGPKEDFASYPRDEAADALVLAQESCDLLYAPTPEVMYPSGFATTISVGGPSEGLDGAARPGHFAGVATVVAKLLIQAGPDVAVFGEKDYQQLAVIRRLAADLDLPVEIVGAPTARAADGFALSSRNGYLTAEERAVAPRLHAALEAAVAALSGGATVAQVEAQGRTTLSAAGFTDIDYFAVHDAETLAQLSGTVTGDARVFAAAKLGRTRLIDNLAAKGLLR